MFGNLAAEMARRKLSGKDICQKVSMSYGSWKSKINGKSDFTRKEMLCIKKNFFPNMTLDYLFPDEII